MLPEDRKFELSDVEVREAQAIIDGAKPGRYTLRQLFGKTRWDALGDDGAKREYGARFKQSYYTGKLQRIVEDGHKSFSMAYSVG